jgi:hypothetical protein
VYGLHHIKIHFTPTTLLNDFSHNDLPRSVPSAIVVPIFLEVELRSFRSDLLYLAVKPAGV